MRMQRTRSSPSALRSPLMRWPLGRASVITFAIAVASLIGCARAPRPGPTLTERSDVEVFDAVVGCKPAERQMLNVTTPISHWQTSVELKRDLAGFMTADETRPALSEETISDFLASQQSAQLSFDAIEQRALKSLRPGLWCSDLRFVSGEQIRSGGLGVVVAVSRAGFNRRANQALVVVNRYQTSNPNGRGSDSWILFLTKPAGQWIIVGRMPLSVV